MASDGERPARVGERIRAELMDLLLRGQLKDPGVRDAIVHEVKVSGDLRYARIFVRLGRPDPSEARQKVLMRGLDRATGFVRRALGKRLKLRHTPEITFVWDDTAERAARIEEILEEVSPPVEEAPVEEAPVEEAPVEEAPVEEAPVEEASAEEPSAEEPAAEEPAAG